MAEQTTTPQSQTDQQPDEQEGRSIVFWVVLAMVGIVGLFVVALIVALVAALLGDPASVADWVGIFRDLFIILLAMEGMVMGIALIVLVIQLAALINLLQNEVQPIVDNANETVSTVRGTAQFMSQNLVEPVVKVSALAAGIGGVLREVLGIRRALNEAGQDGSKPADTSGKQES